MDEKLRDNLESELSMKSVYGAKVIAVELEKKGFMPHECLIAGAVFINVGLEAYEKLTNKCERDLLKKTVIEIINEL